MRQFEITDMFIDFSSILVGSRTISSVLVRIDDYSVAHTSLCKWKHLSEIICARHHIYSKPFVAHVSDTTYMVLWHYTLSYFCTATNSRYLPKCYCSCISETSDHTEHGRDTGVNSCYDHITRIMCVQMHI